VLCAFSSVHAAPLSIELVSEVTSIQPGTPFYVGLHLKHQEHYHTYWKFPGIVGVPTDMAWKLPAGWKAGPIEWPAPERVMMFQIKAQGYHGEVLLPMKITPPKELAVGGKVTLQGKATWMCCGLDCNPGFADLSISLPVETTPRPPDAQWEGLFTKARAGRPMPLKGFEATATRTGEQVTLRLTLAIGADTAKYKAQITSLPAGMTLETINEDVDKLKQTIAESKRGLPAIREQIAANKVVAVNKDWGFVVNDKTNVRPAAAASKPTRIFFTEDGYINADKDQVFRKEGNDLVIELPISTYFTDTPPAELRGILWLKDGSLGKGAIIRAPFAK
jgi:DsbC/DsbD-like thiol-disulfide interchange protein